MTAFGRSERGVVGGRETYLAHHGEAAESHAGLIRLGHGADPDACSREGSGKGRGLFRYFVTKGSRAGRRPRSGGKTGTDLEISSEGAGVAAAHGGLWVIARLRFTGWKGVFGRTSRVSRTGTDDGLGSLRGGALESAEGVTGDGWHCGEGADCGHGDCAWRGFLSLRGSLWCA